MRHYQRYNNLLGWAVWAIATIVYIACAERTVSWWDCGEYISTASKLMVGHPPGAPTFQILGAIANIFTFGHAEYTAFAINIMSALCSSFTILFLFWTITMIAKKMMEKQHPDGLGTFQQAVIYACGLIGALAYTFSDSFWFSSAEGEVYAMSSFFTAITFWAILRWEAVADQPGNLRWIIFIAFMIGLAIGVHLLNLLVLPAIVFTVYYKKFKPSRKGFWFALVLSIVLLGLILWIIIPWTVKLAGYFDVFFVNRLGLPFNSGTIAYFVLLVAALVWGLYQSRKKGRVVMHTALLSLCFMLIGYSTFLTLVIRSNANVPINENEPKDAYSLLAYLNREQYGSRPLLYGAYFNAIPIDIKEGSAIYAKDPASGRYQIIGHNTEYIYEPEDCGLFPRMYSKENSRSRPHQDYYRFWSGTDANENTDKPSGIENMRFLVRYQCGWMYFRYFMWNFAGRQNNIQGLGYNPDGSRDPLHGNWISGIKFLDKLRLGPQDNLPDYLAGNQGRNTFFMLPLLLGICGLVYQCRKFKHSGFVVFLLFFMTGLAIVLYLNQPSTEPRERDYSFAGSFYAFAIWIGLGIMALTDWIGRKANPRIAFPVITVLSLVFVPGLMAQQGWDDHNRSHRTAAYDFGKNSLLSCEANGVLIANGDNDTFPLWYCQEVEGIRPDIRIINSALANSFWHIQPLFRKVYQADPLRFTLPYEAYGQGKDYAYLSNLDLGDYIELSQVLAFAASDDPSTKQRMMDGSLIPVLPVNKVKFSINAQDLLRKGLLTEAQVANVPDAIRYELKPSQSDMVFRSDLAFLDIFASNGFERPIHLASQAAQANILPVEEYAQAEGIVYRIVPYRNPNRQVVGGNGINTGKSYDLFVNRFRWGNLQDPKTAIDPESAGYAGTIRYQYAQLAKALTFEHKQDSAIRVLDKCLEFFPDQKVPYDGIMIYVMEEYFRAGATEKGLKLASRLDEIYSSRLDYMNRFPSRFARTIQYERNECLAVFYEAARRMRPYGDLPGVNDMIASLQKTLTSYGIQ